MRSAPPRRRARRRDENRVPTLLLDASIYIFQYYFSLPDHWYSRKGYPTAAVYGFTAFLLRLIEEQQPLRLAACFDESLGTCFRNRIYPDYKASRAKPDEALAFQLAACREVGELLGIACFSSAEYEADDLLGSLNRRLQRSQSPVAILTRDKDLGQLLRREQDCLWDYAKGERYYATDIHARFGVVPCQLVDYLALVGDSIDDIPGVPGIGPKTAVALLNRFRDIDDIYDNLQSIADLPLRGASTLATKLAAHREQVLMARQLATIIEHLPLALSVKELNWHGARADESGLTRFCQHMGFPRLASRVERVLGG